jgi:hypothetical protein
MYLGNRSPPRSSGRRLDVLQLLCECLCALKQLLLLILIHGFVEAIPEVALVEALEDLGVSVTLQVPDELEEGIDAP